MNKSLSEILESSKDGIDPSYDECYYAMLALSRLYSLEHADLQSVVGNYSIKAHNIILERSYKRQKEAMASTPKTWLGSDIPGDAQYDKMRKIISEISKKFLGH